jgi:hypothetical protein
MTDYYPLISRAVAGLEKNTGEVRRALYERARNALVDQLRSAVPALEESDITRERLALEEAVRKVEAESARRMRFETPRHDPAASRTAGASRRRDAPQDSIREAARESERDIEQESGRDSAPQPPRRGRIEAAVADPDSIPSSPLPSHLPSRERSGGARAQASDQGLRGFRDVVAETERLGNAAALASRSARRAFAAAPSPSPEFARMEPRVEPEGLRTPTGAGNQPLMLEPAFGFDDAYPAMIRPRPPSPPVEEEEDLSLQKPLRSYKGLITVTVAVVVVAAIALMAFWQRHAIPGAVRSVASIFKSQPVQTSRDTAPARAKIPDRILPGGAQQGATATQDQAGATRTNLPGRAPSAVVAQRVVLYEEDANDTSGKRFIGSAIWRTETITPAPGLPPEFVVRADVEIPERRLTVAWSLRRNTDQSLPASHTIEIMFTIPADFPHGGINNVPGLLMKQAEQARGVALSGLAVKVTTGFFLIGLSAVETDVQRNTQLLKERAWFDIPLVYADGKRAILAIEKGTPGERAFNEAFAAWAKRS